MITVTAGSKTHQCVNETAADLWASWYAGRGVTVVRTVAGQVADLVTRLWAMGVRALRALVAGRFTYKPLRKADLVARLAVLGVAL